MIDDDLDEALLILRARLAAGDKLAKAIATAVIAMANLLRP